MIPRGPQSSHLGPGGGALCAPEAPTSALTVCFFGTPGPSPDSPVPSWLPWGGPPHPAPRPHLAPSQQARGSWNLERSLACARCLPACRGTSPDSGQEFLQLAPNKPPGKEEWWEGAGNRLAVRPEWGLVGREPWSGDTQGRTGLQEEEEEGEVGSDLAPQPLSPVPPCTERTALRSCYALL